MAQGVGHFTATGSSASPEQSAYTLHQQWVEQTSIEDLASRKRLYEVPTARLRAYLRGKSLPNIGCMEELMVRCYSHVEGLPADVRRGEAVPCSAPPAPCVGKAAAAAAAAEEEGCKSGSASHSPSPRRPAAAGRPSCRRVRRRRCQSRQSSQSSSSSCGTRSRSPPVARRAGKGSCKKVKTRKDQMRTAAQRGGA
mmetsp:Transcript_104107/g.190699  ORF Transcript_104107/g.190699 Transcript_104107/m.190699 type:complete len:196 (+) Transcript_104107:52-639(+)